MTQTPRFRPPSLVVLLLFGALAQANPLRELAPLPAEPDVPAIHDGYQSIPLHVAESAGVKRTAHPVRGGVPFPKDTVYDWTGLRVVDDRGQPVAAQFDVLSRWWDFSRRRDEASSYAIRWLAVSFLADIEPNQTRVYRLEYGDVPPTTFDAIDIRSRGSELFVNAGQLRATFNRRTGQLMQLHRREEDGWRAMLDAPAELFAEVNGYPPTAGGLWTTLQSLAKAAHWRFLPDPDGVGEHMGFHQLDYDDSSWPHADPFAPWEMQGHARHDGDGWYRTQFEAHKSWRGRNIYFEMRDQKWINLSGGRKLWVFLNGRQIATVTPRGKVDPTDDPAWKQVRVRLPEEQLRFSESNLLAVRAYDAGDGMGGLLCTPLLVAPHDESLDGPYPDPTGRYTNGGDSGAKLTVRRAGPQRAVIEVTGRLHNDRGNALSKYRLGFAFHQNSALMDVDYTFTQTEDPYLARIRSAGLSLPLRTSKPAAVLCGAEPGEPLKAALKSDADRLILYQYHDGEGRYPGYPTLHETPFNPTYEVRDAAGAVLAHGEKTVGWLTANGVSVAMRDFWRDYPSQLSVDGRGRLVAYMWPDAGPEMDLRMWADRKDGGWSRLQADVEGDELVARRAMGSAKNDHREGDSIAPNNAVGVSWTRRLRYHFRIDSPRPARAEAEAIAWDQPVYPFVTAQWNCRSEAVGVPMHPYDPGNFPVIESGIESTIALARIAHEKWMNVYGMFYRGALRYRTSPHMAMNSAYAKTNWSRRWFNQESGKSPSMAPLMQYLRTGHRAHLSFGGVLARFATDVTIRTFHRLPLYTGYAAKHRYTVFGAPAASHTNIEGIILHYCLTGDERARSFLDELNDQYRHEPIERHTVYGNWLDREHDGALLSRLMLWQLDGQDWQRDAVLAGLDFYRRNDLANFTNIGGATYRIAHMTRMWYRTRDPQFLALMADPIAYFVDGETDHLFDIMQFRRTYYMKNLTFLQSGRAMSRAQIEGALRPQHRKPHLGSLFYPGHMLAACYRAGIPNLAIDPQAYPNLLQSHGRYRHPTTFAPAASHRFETIDMRTSVNADPFAIVDAPRRHWSWMGQYHTYNDQSPPLDPTLKQGEIGWDFGAVQDTAVNWRPGYRRSVWPTFEGYELSSNFGGYPFGATVTFNGVPFELIDPVPHERRGYVRTRKGHTTTIPIGRKASRLFFLGHVLNGPNQGKAASVGRYRVRYEDGDEQIVELRDGLHADTWRNTGRLAALTTPVQFARRWNSQYVHGVQNVGLLHVNLFELKVEADRTIEAVELEGLVDGFCLLAVTAEVAGDGHEAPTEVIYDGATRPPVAFGQPLRVALADGWYDVTVDLPKYETQAKVYGYMDVQVTIEAQQKLAVPGFCSRFGQGLTFPVHVSSGELELIVHANGHKPTTTNVINQVTVSPRRQPASSIHARRAAADVNRYGWDTDPFEVGSIGGEGAIDYPRRDEVTRDWVNGDGATFHAAVANGEYKLTILAFAPMGHPAFAPTVCGRKTSPIVLPKQRWSYGDPRVSRAYEKFETYVAIDDGVLSVSFPPGLHGYSWGKVVGIRGMKLTPVSDEAFVASATAANDDAPTNDTWALRLHETFEGSELGDAWKVTDGSWQVSRGAADGKGTLLCTQAFPGAQRVVYQCRSNDPCDLSIILSADWSGIGGGYFVGFGSANNTYSKLLIAGKEAKRWDSTIEPGKLHTVIVERDGGTIRQWIDGELTLTYTHDKPLRGPMVGFYTWTPGVFEDVKVYTKRDGVAARE